MSNPALTENLRAALSGKYLSLGGKDFTVLDGVVSKLLSMALNGDLEAIRFIFDRIDGPAGGVLASGAELKPRWPWAPDGNLDAATLHREAWIDRNAVPKVSGSEAYGPGGFRRPNEPDEAGDTRQSER